MTAGSDAVDRLKSFSYWPLALLVLGYALSSDGALEPLERHIGVVILAGVALFVLWAVWPLMLSALAWLTMEDV